jgi:uncharacterized ParB-like nuclease family protein
LGKKSESLLIDAARPIPPVTLPVATSRTFFAWTRAGTLGEGGCHRHRALLRRKRKALLALRLEVAGGRYTEAMGSHLSALTSSMVRR